jgi:hypothetical protein
MDILTYPERLSSQMLAKKAVFFQIGGEDSGLTTAASCLKCEPCPVLYLALKSLASYLIASLVAPYHTLISSYMKYKVII